MQLSTRKLVSLLTFLVLSLSAGQARAAAPTITTLSPTSGAIGASVTITGTNFSTTPTSNTVTFNGTAATVTSATATTLAVTVPTGATTGSVVVIVAGVASKGKTFTVVAAPSITSLSPTSGAVGASVTITGTNFGTTVAANTVTFNGTTATLTSASKTKIVVPVPSGATTGNVVVFASGIDSNGVSFTLLPTPTLISLSPTSGPVGASVTITGTNFSTTPASNVVEFNGTKATVASATATSLAVTVPSAATTGNVIVSTSGVNTNGLNFTVLPIPTITSLSLTSGAIGASVTITGTNFSTTPTSNTVTFNGTAATVTSATATTLAVTVPTGATTGSVVVTVAGVASKGKTFTVVAAPSITSLSPTSGAVGASVTITGTNFGTTVAANTVTFNGTTATLTSASKTKIVVPVPSGATTGNVVVFASGVNSNGLIFTVPLLGPTITTLSPNAGSVGSSVTIAGTNFSTTLTSNTVTFDGAAATVMSATTTSLLVTVPTNATTGNVVVAVGGLSSNGVTFTVQPPTPTITSLSPTSGPAGTAVVITGTNFSLSESSVYFNGTGADSSTTGTTSITAIVPTGATTGNVVVTVGSLSSNGVNFTVVPTPTIASLSPTSGAVGSTVKITGTNFSTTLAANMVAFNGTPATVTSGTSTTLMVTVPTGATTGDVVVTIDGGASNGVNFTVLPMISSVSPTSGAVGVLVTITGTNFGATQQNSTVKFNGITATPCSICWSETSITVPVPSGATTGNIVVQTSGFSTNGVNFALLTPTSIAVAPQNLSVPLNSPQQYTAVASYSSGPNQNLAASVAWSSSNTSVGTMGANGLLTAVGQGQTTLQATYGTLNASATLTVTGPVFVPVGDLNTARWLHTATLLSNGQVLIVGGLNDQENSLASAELYNPATESFTPTGNLETARADHTATLLSNGMVLISGGIYVNSGNVTLLASAELYNPATGTFTYTTGSMNEARDGTAALLNNGQVLMASGDLSFSNPATAELYNSATGTFTLTGNLFYPVDTTATSLNDGTVLMAGGDDYEGNALSVAQLYNPTAGTFSSTGSLNVGSSGHTSTLLNTGCVLIAGGSFNSNSQGPISRTETYDPVAKVFTLNANMAIARGTHTATLLNNGSVLVIGGDTASGLTGTAELFNPSTQTFTGAGSLEIPRDGHTATLLNDGTVLIVGGDSSAGISASSELYAPAGAPKPTSLQVTPATTNMIVGGTQQFTAVNNIGYPETNATWTVSNPSLATISSDSSPILTAIAAGTVTLTATVDGVSAQSQITISAAGITPTPGSTVWSVPAVPGFSPLQLAQAIPSSAGPDMYLIQSNGTTAVVQAYTGDGQQMWQNNFPVLNANNVPDANGGLLIVENQTCTNGQTQSMSIVDVDPTTGQPLWQINAAGIPGEGQGGATLYCFPDAPQMAVRGDGTIAISAPGNTSGLPEFELVNGTTGSAGAISIPPSLFMDEFGNVIQGYSPIGAPIVDSSDNTYVEYEVRNVNSANQITSAVLYLMEIEEAGPITSIQLSSTTSNENMFPGRIIPDGQGGVLATWVIVPSNGSIPANPYQAAYVISGAVTASYSLPFTPRNFVLGPDSLPLSPSLVLGENGVAFATDGASTGDITNGQGPKIVSFNFASGAVNWTYQPSTQSALSIIATTSSAGVAINDSQNGLMQFDSDGNATTTGTTSGGIPQYSWTQNWYTQGGVGLSQLAPPFGLDPGGIWATPNGNPSQSSAAIPLCECFAQSTDPTQTPENSAIKLTSTGTAMRTGQSPVLAQPAAASNCPVCTLPAPNPPSQTTSCTAPTGGQSTFVILVGDPGINVATGHEHNVGDLFNLAAQTQANSLQSQGNNAIACRVSTIQDVYHALTLNGSISGGVYYFGHSGVFDILTAAKVRISRTTNVFVGQASGSNTNITALNVNFLSPIQTANAGGNFLGPNAAMTINGCQAGLTVFDTSVNQYASIAQLISVNIARGVFAYDVGIYFSQLDAQQDQHIRGVGLYPPDALPMYVVPEGSPGQKPGPLACTPTQPYCVKN
jgi:hypothetical protein